jgi:3-oxoacyl-[acyl-carrier-protein] synthase-3
MKEPKPLMEVAGTGRYLPDRVVTNLELERLVDTSDEWIHERTGIRERRIADPAMGAAQMGAEAARAALCKAGIQPEAVDLILVSTATPDRLLPSTATDVQLQLGASRAAAMDLSAACSGFLYGLSMAEGYLASGRGDVAVVVATEKMSAIVDWHDRSTCVLFGDGAGAVVLRRSDGTRGMLSSFMRSDGALAELLWRPAGGALVPMNEQVLEAGDHLVRMAGREVFKSAVRSMAEASDEALRRAGVTAADIDLVVPHQANMRIIEATARYAGIPMEKVFVNVDRYGNMSSATIPVALDEALEEGRIEAGSLILMVAFGAGLTWASSVHRW